MNSNWGYQWSPAALFSNPCSESYPGAHAFEAVETQVVADYLKNSPNNVRAFVDVHSYGQLCMCLGRETMKSGLILRAQSCSPTRTRAPIFQRTQRRSWRQRSGSPRRSRGFTGRRIKPVKRVISSSAYILVFVIGAVTLMRVIAAWRVMPSTGAMHRPGSSGPIRLN